MWSVHWLEFFCVFSKGLVFGVVGFVFVPPYFIVLAPLYTSCMHLGCPSPFFASIQLLSLSFKKKKKNWHVVASNISIVVGNGRGCFFGKTSCVGLRPCVLSTLSFFLLPPLKMP